MSAAYIDRRIVLAYKWQINPWLVDTKAILKHKDKMEIVL